MLINSTAHEDGRRVGEPGLDESARINIDRLYVLQL
jgi:hypothetical protein